jgi:glutathione S-transferase
MITVHHLSTSRSERIVWLMEELGLEYRLERFRREPSGAAPDALKAIHTLGKAMRLFFDYDLAPYANVLAYLTRIEMRPAYRKAMTLAGAET